MNMLYKNGINTIQALEAAKFSAVIAAISLLSVLFFLFNPSFNLRELSGIMLVYLSMLPFPVLPTFFVTSRVWKYVFKPDTSVSNTYTALVGVCIVIISYLMMCLFIAIFICFLSLFHDVSIVLGRLPLMMIQLFIMILFFMSFSLIVLIPLGAICALIMRRFQVQKLST